MKTTFLAVIVAAACATTTRQGPAARPASPAAPAFTPADVRFMAGMIGHHAQAVLMAGWAPSRSEEHTSELQSQSNIVCRLLLEKKKKKVLQPRTTATATPGPNLCTV